MKPSLPNSNEPVRAQWGRRLLAWIESIRPKGDGVTTKVSPGGVITAYVSDSSSSPFAAAQFFASLKSGVTNTVAINAGRLIRGTNVTAIPQTDHLITIDADGTYYVYLESWENTATRTYKEQYASAATYPNQSDVDDGGNDYPCERFLIATVTVTDAYVTAVVPERIGEIHSNRAWEDF